MNLLNCVYCGSELTHIIGVQKEYINGKVIIIENVPLILCRHCNEEYIPADTMEVINKILSYYEEIINTSQNPIIRVDFENFELQKQPC